MVYMASLAQLLGNAKRMDVYRVANNESVPRRGKKRHYSQMSKEEQDYLFSRLRNVKKWHIGDHALEQMEKKGIDVTYNDIKSTIHTSKIIEYHVAKVKNKEEERVLLRSNAVVNGKYNLHVVYGLGTKTIVSVWLNEVDDVHKTIDMNDYDKNVVIKGFKK